MKTARETALIILHECDTENAYVNIAFKNKVNSQYSAIDAAFIKELVYGTIDRKITLDYIIKQHSKIKLKKISPYIINILRMSIYQLYFMDKIPKSAAVNEGVKLSKKYGHSSAVSFVNAILRKVSALPEIPYPDKKDMLNFLSIYYSHPTEFVEFLIKSYGEEKAESILKANMSSPPLVIRANSLKISRDELIKNLSDIDIVADKSELCPDALVISSGGNILNTDLYKNGFFTIQDTASQLCVLSLNPKKGEKVLDMCAAPGGKTTYLAELMENEGEILAFDLYEKRLLDVEKSAKRLGISIIKTAAKDAQKKSEELIESADKILLDVPCSGLGIIRRKPDIKYKPNLLETEELVSIQKNILSTCSRYLKHGGTLIYSTCTINNDENAAVIADFLDKHKDFAIDYPTEAEISKKAADLIRSGNGMLFPGETDGFFVCRLKRH